MSEVKAQPRAGTTKERGRKLRVTHPRSLAATYEAVIRRQFLHPPRTGADWRRYGAAAIAMRAYMRLLEPTRWCLSAAGVVGSAMRRTV